MSKNSDQCFQNGLLKRIRKEPTFASRSLARARKILNEIPQLVEMELFENAVQRIYQAAFHTVKALLYRDGIKERSHYCVSVYFQEAYHNQLSPPPFNAPGAIAKCPA